MKKSTKEIGNFGEHIAENYLKKRGWRILSNNFSASGGEIDLIGYRFGVLAFFEVKTRSNSAFGAPRDSVDGEKIRRIQQTARVFLKTYCCGNKITVFYPFETEKRKNIRKKRIDVIEVFLSPDKKLEGINHIKDWGNVL